LIWLSVFFAGSGIGFDSSLEGAGGSLAKAFTRDSDGADCILAMTDRHEGKALKNPFDSAFDLLCTGYSRFQRVVDGGPVMLPIGDRLLLLYTRGQAKPANKYGNLVMREKVTGKRADSH